MARVKKNAKKETAREKRKSKTLPSAQLLATFDGFPEAVVLRDGVGRIVFVNRRAEELFGVRRADVVAHTLFPQDGDIAPQLRDALHVPVTDGNEAKCTLMDGEREREFMISEASINFLNGKPATLRIFRETSQEEKRSQLKTQFLSVAAHQLRVPISGIKWALDIFLKGEVGPVTDGQRDLLLRAQDTTERMIRLIGDLLDVSRIEEGRFGYSFSEEKNFPGFVEEIVERFRERAAEKGLQLTFMAPNEAIPALLLDKNRLSLAVENIIANAINYTQKGLVAIRVERRGEQAAIIVQDSGVGISDAQKAKLFHKFSRGDNVQKLGTEGTGLGLFIAHSILRRHGGDIQAESVEGKGTTMILLLPLDATRVPSGEVPLEDASV